MALAAMKELLTDAAAGGYAVGGFEFWSIDSARAILEAAEELGAPVILQAGPGEIEFIGLSVIEHAVIRMIENAGCRAALHLDHSAGVDWVRRAVDAGFTAVMIDASHLDFDGNVRLTREAAAYAKPRGVTLEAEIGRLPGLEGAIDASEADAYQTDVEEAVQFTALTGVDCLAVAVGTVHGFYRAEPKINIGRISELSAAINVPLVLHGGSGTPDGAVRAAIDAGIRKINVCTEFMDAYRTAYKSSGTPSVKGLFEPGFIAGKKIITEKIRLFSIK